MKINKEHFGFLPDTREAFLFTLENVNGVTMQISNYGGTITSLMVPDKNGKLADVVPGLPTWQEWLENPHYFNCIVGRACNRIGGATFSIDGIEYKVSANRDGYQLHGGFNGFQHKLWEANTFKNKNEAGIELHYQSVDGEEGFPGNLRVKATYSLNTKNEIKIDFSAITDQATPVNLTNHAYFNLGGEGSGTIYRTQLMICADSYTLTDSNSIPTGELSPVAGTPFDFREPQEIGARINQLYKGYDNNFVLRNQSGILALAARAYDPQSGRMLELFTTEPGVQLYTSNWFDGKVKGKFDKVYENHTAFCLETQHYPDSMNHPEFPDVILRPGEEYHSTTVWKFSAR